VSGKALAAGEDWPRFFAQNPRLAPCGSHPWLTRSECNVSGIELPPENKREEAELRVSGRRQRKADNRDLHYDELCLLLLLGLFNRTVKADNSYVCRLRDNSAPQVLQERPLTEADRAAGVLSDQLVQFANGKPADQPDHPLRFVCVTTTYPVSRPAKKAPQRRDRRRGTSLRNSTPSARVLPPLLSPAASRLPAKRFGHYISCACSPILSQAVGCLSPFFSRRPGPGGDHENAQLKTDEAVRGEVPRPGLQH